VTRVRRILIAAAGAALLGPFAAAASAAEWEPWPMPAPPGGGLRVPAGFPGDLSFWAPNRGLMSVGGNNAVPEGLYSWDGVEWRQLATVCGGGGSARIAWAGPREFWTITRPSRPRQPSEGHALCHFKDGVVVGSYSTPNAAEDSYHMMHAAACRAPDDCWFAGIGAQDGSGQRVGAFHLHWNGSALRTVYNPQGRAVSDLLVHGGEWFESTYVGRRPGTADPPDLGQQEDPPRLLHRIAGATFVNDPFVPAPVPGVPAEGTELRALDGAGGVAWAVGGGANSGPLRPRNRPPLAARLEDGEWRELPIAGADFEPSDVFADVAAVPGTRTAWAAIRGVTEGSAETSGERTAVALIGEDGSTQVEELVRRGDPRRGSAARVACPAPDDCWLATAQGYLFRRSDAAPYERDTDPAFQNLIVTRPNEAAEQFVPDSPPEDDSRLHAPPLEIIPPPPPPSALRCDPVPSAIARVRKPQVRGRRLVVRFRLRRVARVGLVAYHRKKVVARAKPRRLKAGRRALTLRVNSKRWPTRMRFVVREVKRPKRKCRPGGPSEDVVTTGPGR
jgi:hypothetical protein